MITRFGLNDIVLEFLIETDFRFSRNWHINFEDLFTDDAGAVEGVVEPEVGGEGMVGGGGDDAVFEIVAGG